jgi:ribosomal-protein-alanine N-acetyltransferase
MLFPNITSENLVLKNVFSHDVSMAYIGWLSNPIVNQFLEVRHQTVTLDSQKKFVDEINSSTDSYIFGIHLNDNLMVGTIKVGPINIFHKSAQIGILVGATEYHGKGIGTEAIGSVCSAFKNAKLVRKANAGVLSPNLGSLKAFEKNGFVKEGVRSQQYLDSSGQGVDEILLGKLL